MGGAVSCDIGYVDAMAFGMWDLVDLLPTLGAAAELSSPDRNFISRWPCHGDVGHQVRIEVHGVTGSITAKRSLASTSTRVSGRQTPRFLTPHVVDLERSTTGCGFWADCAEPPPISLKGCDRCGLAKGRSIWKGHLCIFQVWHQ